MSVLYLSEWLGFGTGAYILVVSEWLGLGTGAHMRFVVGFLL